MGKWDKGYEAQTVWKILTEVLNDVAERLRTEDYGLDLPKGLARRKLLARLVHTSILMIQLRNAARISEASEAFHKWLITGKKKVKVRVRKHKNPNSMRTIVIPSVLEDIRDLYKGYDTIDPDTLAQRCKSWSLIRLHINTHSLRYARITDYLERGYNPAIVAKITKHKKMDMLLEYTQERAAEKILEEDEIKI